MNTEYVYNFDSLDKETQIWYYEALRSRLYSIVGYLNQSYNKLNGINSVIKMDYTIDDIVPNNINFNSAINDLSSRVNYISNTVIPEINNKINSLR